jgi:Rnl2 family RNA ligase
MKRIKKQHNNKMSFQEYPRIRNSYDILKYQPVTETITLLEKVSNSEPTFVALEKIHGTNFSFVTDGENVSACRRTAILKQDESFHHFQKILAENKENVIHLFDSTKQYLKDQYQLNIKEIQLFGELYGGLYPDVPKIPQVKMIQKGVFYSNTNDFAAFDLRFTTVEGDVHFMNWNDFEMIMSMNTNIHVVPVIMKGTWEQISSLNPVFESVVYQLHHLPPLVNNWAEGYVIKPLKETNYDETNERLIWKLKHPDFSEMVKTPVGEKKPSKDGLNYDVLESLINQNRYDNVRSKALETVTVQEMVQMFQEDVWKDFNISFTNNISFTKEEEKMYQKKLRTLSNIFVRARFSL